MLKKKEKNSSIAKHETHLWKTTKRTEENKRKTTITKEV